MKRIDILIPTRNRLEKLKRMVASIPREIPGIKLQIRILCDGDVETFKYFQSWRIACNGDRFSLVLATNPSGSVWLRNLEAPECPDAILWAVDDMIFQPGSIEAAVKAMAKKFPDDDGVIGFTQEGQRHFNPAGVGLMGRAFLKRYPGRRPFFPGYFLFACQEIEWLGTKLGKFYLCPEAKIYHFHPHHHQSEIDATHAEGRASRLNDMNLKAKRMKENLIWGDKND